MARIRIRDTIGDYAYVGGEKIRVGFLTAGQRRCGHFVLYR